MRNKCGSPISRKPRLEISSSPKGQTFFSEKVKREIPEVLWDSLVQVSSECEKMLSLDLMLSLYTAWLIGMPLTNGL